MSSYFWAGVLDHIWDLCMHRSLYMVSCSLAHRRRSLRPLNMTDITAHTPEPFFSLGLRIYLQAHTWCSQYRGLHVLCAEQLQMREDSRPLHCRSVTQADLTGSTCDNMPFVTQHKTS